MSIAPDDDWLKSLRPQIAPVTAEQYESLPEETRLSIEILDGYVAYREPPSPNHQRAVRRLAGLLRQCVTPTEHRHRDLQVSSAVDLRLSDDPLSIRRPDVALHRRLDTGEHLYGRRVLLAAEIVTPGTETRDTANKLVEYARTGIPHYWIVWLDQIGVSQIGRYVLDRPTASYKHVGTLMREEEGSTPRLETPIPIEVDWSALRF